MLNRIIFLSLSHHRIPKEFVSLFKRFFFFFFRFFRGFKKKGQSQVKQTTVWQRYNHSWFCFEPLLPSLPHRSCSVTKWLIIAQEDVTQTAMHLVRHSYDAVKCRRACVCVLCSDVQIQWRVGDGARSSGGHSVQSPAGALLPASPGKHCVGSSHHMQFNSSQIILLICHVLHKSAQALKTSDEGQIVLIIGL